MKETICAVIGAVGAAVAAAFGGWTAGLTALVALMAADYVTGLLVAGVFHTSRKSAGGGLESRAGWKGLVRKAVTLVLVLAAGRLDALLGVTYVRDAAVIGFCANELLSVTENAALMGVPLPRALTSALELLRGRETDERLPAAADKEGENESFAEFASADAKEFDRFSPQRVRGEKHFSDCQCASGASACSRPQSNPIRPKSADFGRDSKKENEHD